jgi:hypothetical protein
MPHPEQPSYEELAARNAELTARVAELLAGVAEQAALIETLRAEVAALRRQAGRDSAIAGDRPFQPGQPLRQLCVRRLQLRHPLRQHGVPHREHPDQLSCSSISPSRAASSGMAGTVRHHLGGTLAIKATR